MHRLSQDDEREEQLYAHAHAIHSAEDADADENKDDPLPAFTARNDPFEFGNTHMQQLALALDFGPDDLAYNYERELSPDQIAQLDRDLLWFYGPMIAALAGIAVLIGLITALEGQLALIPALLVLALAAVPALLLKGERERLPDRRVQRTLLRMGMLSLVARRWGLTDDEKLPTAGDKPIFAPKALYNAMQANRTYILYYTPVRTWRGYRLLSLEPGEEFENAEKPKLKPKRG